MGSSPLRAALIGFGQVAEKAHLPAFAEHGVRVEAVCDESAERLTVAEKVLPEARRYTSFAALLREKNDIDFIDIATPPFMHASQAGTALKAGLHVLCEKPLALAPDELDGLRRPPAICGRAIFAVHNWAFSPQWLKIQEIVHSGALGEIRHVELQTLRTQPAASAVPGDWRRDGALAGGGILVDHGWHALYLLRRLLGGEVNRVSAHLHPTSGTVDEEATLFVEYPSATALVHLTWRSGIRRNTSFVVGSRGVLEMLDDEIFLRSSTGTQHFSFNTPLSAGSSHPTWFSAMLPDFFAEIQAPARRGQNLGEASFCLSVIHRAYQSVRYGRNPLRSALTPNERARR